MSCRHPKHAASLPEPPSLPELVQDVFAQPGPLPLPMMLQALGMNENDQQAAVPMDVDEDEKEAMADQPVAAADTELGGTRRVFLEGWGFLR